jgi:ABC-type branched-subunit amino acid transport system substrate-binding protein
MGSYIFGFGYSTELAFKQMAKFAGNTLKSYRFAIITADENASQRKSDAFIEESKSLGNTIVFEDKVVADTADYGALISRATKENCDTIFAALPAPALVKFIKAARSNKFKGKILVGDTLQAPDLATLGADADGIYMTQAFSDDANFKSMYSAKYGAAPDGVTLGYAALGYDTIKCLQSVSSPIDASAIKYSFLSAPCEGLTGKTQFTGERIAQRRKRILTVTGGQILLAE